MTSKEDLKNLRDAFLTIKQEWLEDSNVKLTEWQKNVFDSIEKDLEELEKLKNLMGTPIQDIMKRLKILDILKNQIDIKRGLDTFSKKPVYVIEPKKFAFALSEEKGELIKEWLENDK